MTDIINSSEIIDYICLATYDKKEEVLREVTENDLIFPVAYNRSKIVRLYVMGELMYKNTVTVDIHMDDEKYDVKVIEGRDFTRYSDFENANKSITLSYDTIGFKYLNALPIDILVVSKELSFKDVNINITVKVA